MPHSSDDERPTKKTKISPDEAPSDDMEEKYCPGSELTFPIPSTNAVQQLSWISTTLAVDRDITELPCSLSMKEDSPPPPFDLRLQLWNVQDLGGGPSRTAHSRSDPVIEAIARIIARADADVTAIIEVHRKGAVYSPKTSFGDPRPRNLIDLDWAIFVCVYHKELIRAFNIASPFERGLAPEKSAAIQTLLVRNGITWRKLVIQGKRAFNASKEISDVLSATLGNRELVAKCFNLRFEEVILKYIKKLDDFTAFQRRYLDAIEQAEKKRAYDLAAGLEGGDDDGLDDDDEIDDQDDFPALSESRAEPNPDIGSSMDVDSYPDRDNGIVGTELPADGSFRTIGTLGKLIEFWMENSADPEPFFRGFGLSSQALAALLNMIKAEMELSNPKTTEHLIGTAPCTMEVQNEDAMSDVLDHKEDQNDVGNPADNSLQPDSSAIKSSDQAVAAPIDHFGFNEINRIVKCLNGLGGATYASIPTLEEVTAACDAGNHHFYYTGGESYAFIYQTARCTRAATAPSDGHEEPRDFHFFDGFTGRAPGCASFMFGEATVDLIAHHPPAETSKNKGRTETRVREFNTLREVLGLQRKIERLCFYLADTNANTLGEASEYVPFTNDKFTNEQFLSMLSDDAEWWKKSLFAHAPTSHRSTQIRGSKSDKKLNKPATVEIEMGDLDHSNVVSLENPGHGSGSISNDIRRLIDSHTIVRTPSSRVDPVLLAAAVGAAINSFRRQQDNYNTRFKAFDKIVTVKGSDWARVTRQWIVPLLHAVSPSALTHQPKALLPEMQTKRIEKYCNIIGDSPIMNALCREIKKPSTAEKVGEKILHSDPKAAARILILQRIIKLMSDHSPCVVDYSVRLPATYGRMQSKVPTSPRQLGGNRSDDAPGIVPAFSLATVPVLSNVASNISQLDQMLDDTDGVSNGKTGICNVSNSCYLSAGLSLLASIVSYYNIFEPKPLDDSADIILLRGIVYKILTKVRGGILVQVPEIEELLKQLDSMKLLPKPAPGVGASAADAQQDPGEVIFRKLLGVFNKDTNEVHIKFTVIEDFTDAVLTDILDPPEGIGAVEAGTMRRRNNSDYNKEMMLELEMPLQIPLGGIQGIISQLSVGSEVTDVNVTVAGKAKRGSALRSFEFSDAPNAITIALKRAQSQKKDEREIGVPLQLLLGGVNYRLKTVIFHHGASLNSGHYTCKTYGLKGDVWQDRDDEKVGLGDIDSITSIKKGYMFAYEKIDAQA
ncbi:ubiquitin carboxyl-terminal hydrolase [Duganella sp. HSC-15S17]|uniref:Ubiquitin carboxyl-terminal hydrolase n=2 Tax=Duganella violaceipulchra TaxID=2849652 RepID=A0AA41H755_9BURK|nr:ubiquitin carboxyl-terminal hydrolase family protein [Duganella violaceicalia]MBV6323283.1 ubiquitin carboxyl-terminal hydrolase [Duganella violaceicalia]MCP2007767.1 hypothetical protein [Duganella violaceicalia]